MFSARLLPLCIIVSSLFVVTSCKSKPELSAAEVNSSIKAIQREGDRGNLRQSLNRIALLKDSVDKLSTNDLLQLQVALTQADLQNIYTLCFATAFDTAKQFVEQLTGNANNVPDSLKAAIGTTTGFHLYLAALLNGQPTMDSALALFNSSNKTYATINDKGGEALTSFYMGLCYENNTDSSKNNPGKAEDFYRKALTLSIQAANLRTQSYACRHLAGIAFDKKQMDSAIYFAYESYQLRERSGWYVLRPFTISLLGNILRPTDLVNARKYHALALEFATKYGFPGAITNNQQALAVDDSLLNISKKPLPM
jgi:hypothetical protein